jgi:histone-binding protein RBBP4
MLYVLTLVRDLQQYTPSNKLLKPTRTFTHHSDIVNDVEFNPKIPSFIGTVSDDKTMQVIDTRKQADNTSVLKTTDDCHADAVNAISHNPASEFIVATGSADHTIGIWDLRNLKTRLHSCQGHRDSVTALQWHPFEQSILGSSGNDRRVMFWDLSKVGEEQTPEDSEDGPPELYVL